MQGFSFFVLALSLSLATFSHADSPVPTRLFTVSTYQYENQPGVAITGYNLTARNGNFYLSPKANIQKPVLFVSGDGRAYLNSKKTEPIYVDSKNGLLGYANPPPRGALFVYFVHQGHGSTIFYQGPGYTQIPPGSFQWLGVSGDQAWYACYVNAAGEYQVYRGVSLLGGDIPIANETICTLIDLSALDYSGPSPAADSYP